MRPRDAETRLLRDPNLVLVVHPADLHLWQQRGWIMGYAARIVASTVVRNRGRAMVLNEPDLFLLRDARTT